MVLWTWEELSIQLPAIHELQQVRASSLLYEQPSSLAAESKAPVLLIIKLATEHDPQQDPSTSKPHNHLPKIHPGMDSATNRNEY
jgi:hypothetical protein